MEKGDLLRQFCEESTDKLKSFSDQVLDLEKCKDTEQGYSEMMRDLHSMKGSSRMLGLIPLGNVLHATEDILAALHRQHIRPTSEIIDALLKTSDKLQEALSGALPDNDTSWSTTILTDLSQLQKKITADPDILIENLASHAPEIFQVLSPHQKQMLAEHYYEYKHLYEISILFQQKTFVSEVELIHSALKDEGLLLSTTGSRRQPTPGFDLCLTFLHLSSTNPDALKVRLHGFSIDIRELPRQTAQSTQQKSLGGFITDEEQIEVEEKEPHTEINKLLTQLEFDDEFRELQQWFLEEGEENLKKLSHEIISLETDPTDIEDKINAIFRTFHNFKGSGGSYKFPHISRIAHHLESFVDILRKDRLLITGNVIDAMLKGVDILISIFADCKHKKHDEIPIGSLERNLQEILGMNSIIAPAVESTPSLHETQQPILHHQIKPVHKIAENVRIQITKLDYIVNTAVELAIAHHAEESILSHISSYIQNQIHSALDWNMLRQFIEAACEPSTPDIGHMLDVYSDSLNRDINALQSIIQLYEKNSSLRSLLSKQLRDEVLELQLLPLELLFESFPRIVRDLSKSLQKEITLEIEGSDVEVDRKIIDALKDPLIHLIRNAIDHGIESPEQRILAGKPKAGKVKIKAESLGYSFSITIEDDGNGLDKNKIAAIILKQGLATQDELERMTTNEIYEFIFLPGFTTCEQVTDISGRGVGLDVVLTNLKKFGGEIYIHSETGKRTAFQLLLPCSLILSKVLLIKVHQKFFSLPTGSIDRIVLIENHQISEYQGKKTYLYENVYLPIIVLEDFLAIDYETTYPRYGIILRKGITKICLSVPRVISEAELMTKPLPFHLRNIPAFSGANVLPDGTISLFLNPLAINYSERSIGRRESHIEKYHKRKILVVDDSFISRELIKNILLTYGYEVSTASNGLEALTFLRNNTVELVVSDIHMPRMNGIELTHAMKSDPRLLSVPVIIITSQSEEEHRQRGLEIGADAYIVKGNFTQQNLISTIERLIPVTV